MTRHRLLPTIGLAVLLPLVAACGDDTSDPDPGAPGSETELDGGETDPDGSTTTEPSDMTTGGGTGTEGNQLTPGETTPTTAGEAGDDGG
jgi:hypothetical protein